MRLDRRLPSALVLLTLLAACSSGAAGRAAPSPSPTGSSPAPSPSPSPAAVDPLTGTPPRPTAPVVVVKVDNVAIARPFQRGLDRAAVVYQELVESGETRLAAVYDQPVSSEVGPVRSVRESDIELLRQYGRVAVGFSGGNTGVKATFARAVRDGHLLDASFDTVPQDYRLAERRVDARNFYTTPVALGRSRPGEPARDIGLRFAAPVPPGGTPVVRGRAVFSPFVTVTFAYDPASRAWSVAQNGRRMPAVAPANVVVQQVPIRRTGYVDVRGNYSPYTVTVGRGPVTVFRDGRAVTGTWRRLTVDTGTRYLDASGRDIPLRPGPTWVLLLPRGQALRTG